MDQLKTILIAVTLASLCAGCMFEIQRAAGCDNVGVFGCKDKAQPHGTDGHALREAEGRRSVSSYRDNSGVEPLSFGTFRLELPEGWVHAVESRHGADGWGDLIVIHHPNGAGTLRIRSYAAPDPVGERVLRNMTNLDSSVPLTLQRWGEYLGYQHDYVEGDSFFRQWWLANGQALIFVTYSCRADQRGVENTAIDRLVDSLTAIAP